MITSPHNEQLKTIRKLHDKSWRDKLGLFCAEGEDLVEAAAAAGWEPRVLLRAGQDVESELLDGVSALGSGTRVIGVYEQRWSEPGGRLSVYLHGVADPGNVGAIIRTAHALADGPVVLGPGCADPWSPKAVRASMGSIFARPPARGAPTGTPVALDAHAELTLAEAASDLLREGVPYESHHSGGFRAEPPSLTVCLGAEREGLPAELSGVRARIALAAGGPESLNVAAAAAIALYELRNRMAGHA
jgi:TrmH family RNA methyltransferase